MTPPKLIIIIIMDTYIMSVSGFKVLITLYQEIIRIISPQLSSAKIFALRLWYSPYKSAPYLQPKYWSGPFKFRESGQPVFNWNKTNSMDTQNRKLLYIPAICTHCFRSLFSSLSLSKEFLNCKPVKVGQQKEKITLLTQSVQRYLYHVWKKY